MGCDLLPWATSSPGMWVQGEISPSGCEHRKDGPPRMSPPAPAAAGCQAATLRVLGAGVEAGPEQHHGMPSSSRGLQRCGGVTGAVLRDVRGKCGHRSPAAPPSVHPSIRPSEKGRSPRPWGRGLARRPRCDLEGGARPPGRQARRPADTTVSGKQGLGSWGSGLLLPQQLGFQGSSARPAVEPPPSPGDGVSLEPVLTLDGCHLDWPPPLLRVEGGSEALGRLLRVGPTAHGRLKLHLLHFPFSSP